MKTNILTTSFEPTIQLSNKIRISPISNKAKAVGKSEPFYSKYSRFALKALKRCRYQEFLNLMLETEGIDQENVDSIKVGVYPVRKKAGLGIAGKCNPTTGKIYLYPKSKRFCHQIKEKYGRKLLLTYVGNRARASLIHELLHVKYLSDEQKVRALTKIYYSIYVNGNKASSSSVYNLIFGYCEQKI